MWVAEAVVAQLVGVWEVCPHPATLGLGMVEVGVVVTLVVLVVRAVLAVPREEAEAAALGVQQQEALAALAPAAR